MPRYFTHIRDGGTLIKDVEGEIFADLDAAKAEGVYAIRQMLADRLKAGEVIDGQTLEICDDRGATLAILRFRDELRLT